MLQIAIWGIAAMLVVKALDVLHQQSISRASGNAGSEELSKVAAAIAIVAAIALVAMADKQTEGMANTSSPFGSTADSGQEMDAAPLPAMSEDEFKNLSPPARAAYKDAGREASDAARAASEAASAAFNGK